jgi:hypothetical protein
VMDGSQCTQKHVHTLEALAHTTNTYTLCKHTHKHKRKQSYTQRHTDTSAHTANVFSKYRYT